MSMTPSLDELEKLLRRCEIGRRHERATAEECGELARLSRALMARFLDDHDYRFLNLALKLNDAVRKWGAHGEIATLAEDERCCLELVRRLTGLAPAS